MEVLSVLLPAWEELQTIKLFLILTISLLFLFSRKLFLTRSPQTKLKLPPSPPKLPIIGNLHQLSKLPHRSLRALSRKYGPLMLLNLGLAPTLVVSSDELVKEITKTHDVVFSNRPKFTAADIFFYGCLDVGFAPYGEYWRQARKICVVELLSLKRVVSLGFVREEETARLVQELRDASSRGVSVNLSRMLASTSNDMISRCILGRQFEEDDETRSRFLELSERLMTEFTAFSFGDLFPSLRLMDVVTGWFPNSRQPPRN